MHIRLIKENDAMQMLELFKKLDTETRYLLFEPEERKTSLQEQALINKEFSNSDHKVIFVAEENQQIIGFISGEGGIVNRKKHALNIVIGVMQNSWGKGIGAALMTQLENWATVRKFHRLELVVMENNHKARTLYIKQGFIEEGIKRDSMMIQGKYINGIYMSKLI